MRWDLLDAFRRAAEQANIKSVVDFNAGDNEGCCAFHVNQKRGRRWSAAPASSSRCCIAPICGWRPAAWSRAWCSRAGAPSACAGGKASKNGWPAAAAKSSSRPASIGSPQIMLLSGVGPAQQLQEHGIPVVLDRPGVGANLQDHLQLRLIYKVDGITHAQRAVSLPARAGRHAAEYALFRRGPLTMAPSQLGLFTRSDPDQERANIEFHIQPLSLDRFGEPLHKFPAFTASVANLRPTSRGYLRLRSRDPADKPVIKLNYLSTEQDRRIAISSIRLTRRIAAQPALAPFHPAEYLPGPAVRDDDEQTLVKAAGDIGTTIFHPVGTAKMGLRQRPADRGRRAAARRRDRAPARHRCFRHAHDHVRQHQRSNHDDRGKGRRLDPRRRQDALMNAAWRARAILADPAGAWARIETEPGDAADLLTSYVVLLALIPAVFGFIGACVVGTIVPGVGVVRAPILGGLFGAVFGYVTTCATVLLLGLLINALAPRFGGRRNFDSAFKLAVYSYTPVWLAGIFLLEPGLRFLGLTGFYGAYILWCGLPRLMKTPARRVPPYTAVIVAGACALALITAAAQHALFGSADCQVFGAKSGRPLT